MADTRIDELRRRLERDPGSRLFAQLAEELRKNGELVEAIRVARAGLAVHSSYPSARLTLGRALLETGDATTARAELESVLRDAPDNILASRYLAQARETLGDLKGALDQYQKTLLMAPGDQQVQAHLSAVEARLNEAPRAARRTRAGAAAVRRCVATGGPRSGPGGRPGRAAADGAPPARAAATSASRALARAGARRAEGACALREPLPERDRAPAAERRGAHGHGAG